MQDDQAALWNYPLLVNSVPVESKFPSSGLIAGFLILLLVLPLCGMAQVFGVSEVFRESQCEWWSEVLLVALQII